MLKLIVNVNFKSLKSDGAVWWLQELLGDCRVCLGTVQVCSVTASPIPLVRQLKTIVTLHSEGSEPFEPLFIRRWSQCRSRSRFLFVWSQNRLTSYRRSNTVHDLRIGKSLPPLSFMATAWLGGGGETILKRQNWHHNQIQVIYKLIFKCCLQL